MEPALPKPAAPRRSYIRRKRYLQASTICIYKTFVTLHARGFLNLTDAEIGQFSFERAQEVDALCWSPKLTITEDQYET
jgi:hypothetical protein